MKEQINSDRIYPARPDRALHLSASQVAMRHDPARVGSWYRSRARGDASPERIGHDDGTSTVEKERAR